jgi:hypothetical protein
MLRGRPRRHARRVRRARPEIDDEVRRLDHLAVVLDDEHGVVQVAKVPEAVDELAVVARMQPDRRLVEDVEHAR